MELQNSFADFISHNKGQKEISLAIAKTDTELESFKSELDKNDYKEINNVIDLLKFIKSSGQFYLDLDINFSKEIYDTLVQYSTGQIQVFNKETNQSVIVSPDYSKLSLVFLITQEKLDKIRKDNFDILSLTGLCFRK